MLLLIFRFRSSFELDGHECERGDASQRREAKRTDGYQQTGDKSLPTIRQSTKQCRRRQTESSTSITEVITSVERENALIHSKTHTPDLHIQSSRNQRTTDARAVSIFGNKNAIASKTNNVSRPVNVQRMTSTLFGDSHSLYVPRMINVSSTRFGASRRFKSEERSATDTRKRLEWEAERYLGKLPGHQQESERKDLISIVGKLPTVRKGTLKTLQTLQKEKYCGEKHADVTQSKAVEDSLLGPDEEQVTKLGDHVGLPGILGDNPGNKQHPEKTRDEVTAQDNEKTVAETALSLDHRLQGHHLKMNPPKMRNPVKVSDASANDGNRQKTESLKKSENISVEKQTISEAEPENKFQELCQLPKESTDDLKQDVKWVQNAIDTSAIIDAGGYGAFARSSEPNSSEQKSSEKGDNNIDSMPNTEEDLKAHASYTEFGNSKCYPKFSSDGFSPATNGALKSPRKLSKFKRLN